MKFLKNIPVIARANIYFSTIAILVFTIFGLFIYQNAKQKNYEQANFLMTNQLNSLIKFFLLDERSIENNLKSSNIIFDHLISNQLGSFSFVNNRKEYTEAFDVELKQPVRLELDKWLYNGLPIDENNQFLASFADLLNCQVAIWQKTDKGFIMIATSDENIKIEERTLFLSNNNQIAFKIKNGDFYFGKEVWLGKIYIISAIPMYYNGEIVGMLMTYKKHYLSDDIKIYFNSQRYFGRGYPFMMDNSGILVVHPYLQDVNIIKTAIYGKIIQAKNHPGIYTIYYKWPETIEGEYKYMQVKYMPEYQLYIGVTYYEKDLNAALKKIKRFVILAIIGSSVLFITLISVILQTLLIRLKNLKKNLNLLKKGIIPEKIKVRLNDEVGTIIKDINQLTDNLNEWIKFTKKLTEGNYENKLSFLSEEDQLSENLSIIQEKLKQIQKEEKERGINEKINSWRNKGYETFIDILGTPNIDINTLSKLILKELIEFLHSIEGGIFLVNDEEEEEKYLELISAYAYNAERNIQRKIPFGSGLIGRIAIEKKTLLLTEIPEDYTSVNTALGGMKPNYLIIVPLLYMNQILGVIELASIDEYKDYEVKFLEEISDNIAASISALKITQRTEKLLSQSREQTKILEEQRKALESQIQELELVRKKSEQKEQELQSLFQAIEQSAMLLEMDIDGKILTINKPYAELFSRPPEFFIGKKFQVVTTMNPASDDYRKFFQTLKKGNSIKIVETLNLGDKNIWLSHNYTPIKDEKGNIIKILDIAFDITETKLLEKQLRNQVKEIAKEARLIRKEERKIQREREDFLNKEISYKTIIEAADDFIIRIEHTLEGNINFVNTKFANLIKTVESKIYQSNLKDFMDIDSIKKYGKNASALKAGRRVRAIYIFKDSENNKIETEITQIPIIKKQKVQKIILIGKII